MTTLRTKPTLFDVPDFDYLQNNLANNGETAALK